MNLFEDRERKGEIDTIVGSSMLMLRNEDSNVENDKEIRYETLLSR